MTYNAAIPQSTDLISQSQSQIQTNFSQANIAFGIDHTAFDVVSNQGKHKKSTYVEQAADPATGANEVDVYSKDTGTQPDLFYRPENNGTPVRLTGGGLTAAAWVYFNVNTGNGAITINDSYNVSSVTNGGVNTNKTITFSRAFLSGNYVAIINAYQTGAGDTINRKTNIVSIAAGSTVFNVTNAATTAQNEVPIYQCVFFGTLT